MSKRGKILIADDDALFRQTITAVQRALARAELQRRMLELQQRWRLWAADLLDGAAMIEPGVVAETLTIETMLTVSLQNLSRCIAEVHESPVAAPTLAQRCAADALIPAVESRTAAAVSGPGEQELVTHAKDREIEGFGRKR